MSPSNLGCVRFGMAAIALSWLAFIASQTVQRWPGLPLDIDARDPQTGAAYQLATLHHVLRAAELGVAGIVVAFALWRLIRWRNRD